MAAACSVLVEHTYAQQQFTQFDIMKILTQEEVVMLLKIATRFYHDLSEWKAGREQIDFLRLTKTPGFTVNPGDFDPTATALRRFAKMVNGTHFGILKPLQGLLKGSTGPLIVLGNQMAEMQDIINLFQPTIENTHKLCSMVMDFAAKYMLDLLNAFIDMAKIGQDAKDENHHYFGVAIEICEFAIRTYRKGGIPLLYECGFSYYIMYQTWKLDSKDPKLAHANFSVFSPHFQSLLYLRSNSESHFTREQINDFNTFTQLLIHEMITKGYRKQFVFMGDAIDPKHPDSLANLLSEMMKRNQPPMSEPCNAN